jgi:hypothetical protein
MNADAKALLADWVAVYEAQSNGLPADPDALEALVARSRDFIENN